MSSRESNETESEQAEASALEQFILEDRRQRIDDVLRKRCRNLIVVLDNVHNPHNIAAVLRSCDAFGIQHVHIIAETFEPARGISLGSERWLSITRHKNTESLLTMLAAQSFRIVILEAENKEQPEIPTCRVQDLPFHENLALVFGNEHRGVDPTLREAASLHAHIPMFGFVESLNISVAAAITFFCSTLDSSQEGTATVPLTPAERTLLREDWLAKSLRNADLIRDELAKRSRTT